MKPSYRPPFLLLTLMAAGSMSADVVLTEFLTRNETSAQDDMGAFSDWLEITNTGEEAVALDEWALTDNANRPRKWQFPAGARLEGGERRLVFATGRNQRTLEAEWHTNFRLAAAGEYVALVRPDGEVANAFEAAPQFDDVAYGLSAEGQVGYLVGASPLESNGALAHPGPLIAEVNHLPEVVEPMTDIVVRARVASRGRAVETVRLTHRVDHKTEGSVAMVDDGSGSDEEAGDGIYTAVISGRTLFGPKIPAGSMARWYVSAEDVEGQTSRFPPFLDSEGVDQSAEYLGIMVEAELDTELPVFHWFTDEVGSSRTRRGARATVVYAGALYDNVFVRQRGGATNGSSQKFVFNKAYPIFVNEDLPAVSELNLNAQGSDASYLRQPLAFETYRWAGNASCHSFLTVMRLNGEEDRTGVLIEQVDDDFLSRNGFDPLGDLYKLVQRSNLNPVFADVSTGVEKKTGDTRDLASLQSLVDGLALEGAERKAFLMDALNLPQVMNYLAGRSITQDADDVRKNFYVYNDIHGTGEWSIFPWDKDWTFGVTGDGGPHLQHPFFGDQKHLKTNANQWNRLYDAVFKESVTRQMYLRRLRTLADALLQPQETPEEERRFENRIDEMFARAQGDVPNGAPAAVKRFFPDRREDLFETYARGGRESLLPDSQEVAPTVTFGEIVFSPETGNQDHEYIELINGNRTAVDVSGWRLEGGVTFTFAEGTVIPSGSVFNPGIDRLYLSPDVSMFRSRPTSPTGGEGRFVQGPYRGHLSNFGESLTLMTGEGEGEVIAEIAYEGNPSDVERFLAVSEIMYHPSEDRPDSEFLELVNLSPDLTLDLSGLQFTRGIAFTFADGVHLEPGEVLLLVQDETAFAAVYGDAHPIAGSFGETSRLANGGETLKLDDANGNTIFEFRYDDEDEWPSAPDGTGPSLEFLDPNRRSELGEPTVWEASAEPGGTPGRARSDGGGPNLDLTDGDGDGLVAVLEKAFGTSDADPSQGPGVVRVLRAGGEVRISVPLGELDGLELGLEWSSDLQTWQPAGAAALVSQEEGQMIWTLSAPSVGSIGQAGAFRIRMAP